MKTLSIKNILIYLAIAFVIVSIWQNPADASQRAGDFLGGLGGFLEDLIDKSATFVKGLFE